jgi:hypothetical protein
MKKIDFDEYKNRIYNKHGESIVVLNYISMQKDADFECTICGHKWTEQAILVIDKGHGCEKCCPPRKNRKGYPPISFAEAKTKIKETHGDKLEILEYKNGSVDAKFRCNVCGNEWYMIPRFVWRGNGCKKCGYKDGSAQNRMPIEEVRQYIEDNNCKLISDVYVNDKEKIDIQFECGHIKPMSFDCFKRGHRCQDCAKLNKKDDPKKYSMEKILKLMIDNNLELIEFPDGYKNRESRIIYKCQHGHTNDCRFAYFMENKTCKECVRIKQSINQLGSKGSNWQGGLTELKVYTNKFIIDWKRKSMKDCDYKCVITGKRFSDIHHLYGFNLILKEAVYELGLEQKELNGDYTDDQIYLIILKIQELHKKYPLGVCLTKDLHVLFHKYYGSGDNYPWQFDEFKQKIVSGEIVIPI